MKRPLAMPRLLPVTIAALVAVLVLRTAGVTRAAFPAASSGTALAAEPEPAHSPAAKPAAPPTPVPPATPAPVAAPAVPAEPPVSESERALLLDLRKRRGELDAREAAIVSRESVLNAAQARLTARLDELNGLQKRLEGLEAARRERDEASWRGLVRLYETMKPKDAAAIFNDLDPAVLLPVLDRMKEAKAAPILSAMQPNRAREVTDGLAHLRVRDPNAPRDRG